MAQSKVSSCSAKKLWIAVWKAGATRADGAIGAEK
jgi:hypothetical protein